MRCTALWLRTHWRQHLRPTPGVRRISATAAASSPTAPTASSPTAGASLACRRALLPHLPQRRDSLCAEDLRNLALLLLADRLAPRPRARRLGPLGLLARLALRDALLLLPLEARRTQLARRVLRLGDLGCELLRQTLAAFLSRRWCERREVADLAALSDLEDVEVGEAASAALARCTHLDGLMTSQCACHAACSSPNSTACNLHSPLLDDSALEADQLRADIGSNSHVLLRQALESRRLGSRRWRRLGSG